MSGWLEGPILNIIEKSLDASSLRQKVIANNVANVDTPNFKRSDVNFETLLNETISDQNGNLPLKVSSAKHLSGIGNSNQNGIVTDQSTSFRNDGNNVDIDREMANVAQNGLYYQSMTRAISSQLDLLRTVIKPR